MQAAPQARRARLIAWPGLVTGTSVLLAAFAPATWAMDFRVERNCGASHAAGEPDAGTEASCAALVIAEGPIEAESATDFRNAARGLPPGSTVLLASRGGNLAGGLRLGQAIREMRLNTRVGSAGEHPPVCYSACAYAFLGGVVRTLDPQSKLGVHQFHARERDVDPSQAQRIGAALGRYVDAMGVDRRFLDLASLTAHDRIAVVPLDVARKLRADNSTVPPSRWRLNAADDGRLVALTSQRAPGRPDVVSLALGRAGDAVRLLIRVDVPTVPATGTGQLGTGSSPGAPAAAQSGTPAAVAPPAWTAPPAAPLRSTGSSMPADRAPAATPVPAAAAAAAATAALAPAAAPGNAPREGKLAEGGPPTLRIGDRRHPLAANGIWTVRGGTRQASYAVPDTVLDALAALPEDGTFDIENVLPPLPGATVVAPGAAAVQFGAGGLKPAIAALRRSN